MTQLDLHDIQGNIVKAYGRYGFPLGRYVLFSVLDHSAGRQFVQALAPAMQVDNPHATFPIIGALAYNVRRRLRHGFDQSAVASAHLHSVLAEMTRT